MEKFSQRLNKLIEYKGIKNANEFGKVLGYKSSEKISRLLRDENNQPSFEIIQDITNLYNDLNPRWLITGIGEMLVNNNLESKINTKLEIRTLVIATDQKGEELLQFVPAFAHAGYLSGYCDPEYIENLPTMSITGMLPNGTYRGWEVKGDSMEPTYRPGDKLIARYQDDWYRIKTGNTYVIVSRGDVVVKRVINKLKDENRLICQSDNKYYPEYDVDLDEIIEIWSVEAFVRIGQIAPKTNIDDLRSEIDRLRKELGK